MKKRLLSAALALAMVLTLLPVSVFAAVTYGDPSPKAPNASGGKGTDVNGKEVIFYDISDGKNITQSVSRCTTPGDGTKRDFGKWYWLDNKTDPQKPVYYEVTTGIIAGDNGSGNWYPDQAAFTTTSTGTFEGTANATISKLRSTSLTLLGATDLDMSTGNWSDTTLRVDIEGTGTLTLAQNATNVTVTSKFVTGTPTGQVAAITRDHSAYDAANKGTTTAALTLNATNVNVGAINLDGRANGVTLTDCVLTGGVDMDGSTVSKSGGTKDTFSRQIFSATNCKLTGTLSFLGDGSQVSLTSTTGADATTATGSLTVTGHGGTLTIAGASNVGAVVTKSRATSVDDTTISNIPTVTVSGGKLTSINTTTDAGNGSASITLNRSTGNTNVGEVAVNKGSVSVAAGVTTTNITVPEGSVTIAGSTNTSAAIGTGATTGTLILGGSGKTTLSISGYGSDIKGITVPTGDGANLTINNGWPASRNNDFGTVDLDSFSGKKIAGGTFALGAGGVLPFTDAESYGWIDTSNLTYQAKVDGKAKLYSVNELGQAIDDVNGDGSDLTTDGAAATKGNIIPIGNAGTNSLTLKYGSGTLAVIAFNALTPIVLPSRLSSKNIVSWMQMDAAGDPVKSYVSGQTYTIPAQDIILNAADMAEDVTKITGISNASSSSAVTGNNIRAVLSGNTINLSGAVVDGLNNMTGLTLDLTTDVVKSDGSVVVLTGVPVDFNTKTKAAQFNEFWLGQNGAVVKDGKLVLANGTTYTVNGSGLSVSASDLKLAAEDTDGYEIAVTVGGRLSSWRPEAKDDLIALLNGGTAGFSIKKGGNNNRAMLEAINAAQATITSNTSVENWVNSTRSTIWTRGFKSAIATTNTAPGGYAVSGTGNLTPHGGTYANAATTDDDKAAITSAFSTAYIVPYLQVNITDYDESGTLTATLTPSYRVDVSGAAYDYTTGLVYTVQTGRALSALTGDMSTPVTVKFNLGPDFENQYMHQDGKYVYQGDGGAWEINHAGTTGLGTIEINGLPGLVELKNPKSDGTLGNAVQYDSLQAAVDDTIPGVKKADGTFLNSEITIKSGFDGSCTFTMDGLARTINIKSLGNKDVSCTSNYVDKTDLNGVDFTFQLKRDTAPTGGNITISSATGGSASVNANPAKVGSTVTITLSASAGYTASGVSVKTASGQTVSVSGSGSSYTFTMPSGSVTVTPSFTKTNTNATISVNRAITGTGTASTNASGQVSPGTQVTVTTTPGAGQRTMGLSVTGATAIRTGVNTFTFTVPSGYSTVTVTPSFDANNNTIFADVWSSSYYSKAVSWAVNKNPQVTNGSDTYNFSPEDVCNRAQMVTFLWRAAGRPSVAGIANPFVDVSATQTPGDYYSAILWAVSQGITDGTDRTHFSPYATVTRGQAVTFLYRYEKSPAASTNSGFYDVSSREYYARPVSWANAKGVTKGTSTTMFSPNDPVTRAQAVTFLYRDVTGDIA